MSLIVFVTQKYDQNNKHPISFMTTSLQGHELSYPAIKKQVHTIYKAVKHFRPYL